MRSKKEYVQERNKKFVAEIKTYHWSFVTKCIIKYYELRYKKKLDNLHIGVLSKILNRCKSKELKSL